MSYAHLLFDKVHVHIYTLEMEQIKKLIKDKIIRKIFWLPESQTDMIAKEAKHWKNESALMQHIISNWFSK